MHDDDAQEPAAGVSPERWLTPGVGAVGAASFFSDAGHEMATSMLPTFLTFFKRVVPTKQGHANFLVIPTFDFSTPTNAPGSPHTLVLSPAALRVADLTRYSSSTHL